MIVYHLFCIIGFYLDLKDGEVVRLEFVLVLLQVYSQWKVVKYLFAFAVRHQDENRLNADKEKFERNTAPKEPFTESVWQGGKDGLNFIVQFKLRHLVKNI